jgi:hypothetical protein
VPPIERARFGGSDDASAGAIEYGAVPAVTPRLTENGSPTVATGNASGDACDTRIADTRIV